jgi:hypothetical protein
MAVLRGPQREIIVTAARCPDCGSTRLRAYRTECSDDHGAIRHSRCKVCGLKIRIVIQ